MSNPLIEFWRSAAFNQPPYIHPKDIPAVRRICPQYLERLDRADDDPYRIHFELLPQPYMGDLEEADIFVLTYKPGFGANGAEYVWEDDPMFVASLRQTIYQRSNKPIPFIFLDPQYAAHPGSGYWMDRLRGTAPYPALAQRLAVLELMPYHAKDCSSRTNRLARELESANVARRFVKSHLLPRARRGEILLVAVRQVTNWGLKGEPEGQHFVKYSGGESRGAYLTPGTKRGGPAIQQWIAAR